MVTRARREGVGELAGLFGFTNTDEITLPLAVLVVEPGGAFTGGNDHRVETVGTVEPGSDVKYSMELTWYGLLTSSE
jgi:hypothetical protein